MKEIWKPIKDFEGLYDISNKGNIYSHRKKRNLILSLEKNGYVRVGLQKTNRKDAKHFYVHRLVAEAFIPNIENKPFVNHKDENKQNNNVSNLEWCTIKENMNYGTRNERIRNKNKNSLYLSKKIRCIDTDTIYPSMSEASRQTNIHLPNICKCCNGERKVAGGYKWEII